MRGLTAGNLLPYVRADHHEARGPHVALGHLHSFSNIV